MVLQSHTNKQKHTIGTKKYQPYHWSGEFEIMNDLLNTKRMERAMAYPNNLSKPIGPFQSLNKDSVTGHHESGYSVLAARRC
jgi:hypothetical protein